MPTVSLDLLMISPFDSFHQFNKRERERGRRLPSFLVIAIDECNFVLVQRFAPAIQFHAELPSSFLFTETGWQRETEFLHSTPSKSRSIFFSSALIKKSIAMCFASECHRSEATTKLFLLHALSQPPCERLLCVQTEDQN